MLTKEEKKKRIKSFYRYIFTIIASFIGICLSIGLILINLIIPNKLTIDIIIMIFSLFLFANFIIFTIFLDNQKETVRNIFKEFKKSK